MVIHEFVLATSHVQPLAIATPTMPVSEPKPWLKSTGASVASQGAADCETENAASPTVIVPDREVLSGFACTKYPTVPSPKPLVPETREIQPFVAVAVQIHSDGAVTLN